MTPPPLSLTDEDLFARWAAGDRASGHKLLARHFDAILRFFRRSLGDDTGDLVQDTFLGCVKAQDRFEGRSSFRTFLFAIARHHLYKELRRRSRRPEIDFRVTSLHDLGPTPTTALREREALHQLAQALEHLPLEQQLTVHLYYLEDLSAPDVGVALGGLSIPAVRSRLRRALLRLRELIEHLPALGAEHGASLATLERWEASLPPLPANSVEPSEAEIPLLGVD